MKKESTTELVRKAVKVGLDMREVSERLEKSAFEAEGLTLWRRWVRAEIHHKEKQVALGY